MKKKFEPKFFEELRILFDRVEKIENRLIQNEKDMDRLLQILIKMSGKGLDGK